MKKLIILLFLSSCLRTEDKSIHSKGIVAGFYEQKNTNTGAITKYTSIQDTSGKILSVLRKKCTDCLLNDSVKILYYDNSLIEDAGDKYEIDSCVKFARPSWKPEKYVVKHIVMDTTGRIFKEIDTTYIFK